jgi:hypothetical protein
LLLTSKAIDFEVFFFDSQDAPPGAALGFASLGLLTGSLWYYYMLAFLGGVFAPGASALTYSKIVSSWFDRNRGIALSTLACI